jgi:glycosyltransferase involved in cell wall biosynthesis
MSIKKQNKVLFVIDTLEIGGAEKSLLSNIARFKSIQPVVCHIYKGDSLKQKFTEKGIIVYSLNVPGKYNFLNAYKQLVQLIKHEQPDLMVAYLTRSEIVTRLAGRIYHTPVIGTFVNDLYCKDYNKHLPLKARLGVQFFKYINKWMSKSCVGFVANSAAIKDANATHLSIHPAKIKVINRGRESRNILLRNSDVITQEKSMRFLNVSRLRPIKAQKLLIEAFKLFSNNFPDAVLHIAGDGPLYEELTAMIAHNGLQQRVTLLGERNDIASLLAEYDCFVFPSLVEGFSGAVVEAMFAKLPVLASDIAQNEEAIMHMQTGFLFEKNSVKAIEEALFWFAGNRTKANQMAEQAYKYAKENFELQHIAETFEDYLQSTI